METSKKRTANDAGFIEASPRPAPANPATLPAPLAEQLKRILQQTKTIQATELKDYILHIIDRAECDPESATARGLCAVFTGEKYAAYAKKHKEKKLHCARCHGDFLDSTRERCLIEHDLQNCVRVRKMGEVASIWKYECCGYKFKSPYNDEPEDPDEDMDKDIYCFIGDHETNEELVAKEGRNHWVDCRETGCHRGPEERSGR